MHMMSYPVNYHYSYGLPSYNAPFQQYIQNPLRFNNSILPTKMDNRPLHEPHMDNSFPVWMIRNNGAPGNTGLKPVSTVGNKMENNCNDLTPDKSVQSTIEIKKEDKNEACPYLNSGNYTACCSNISSASIAQSNSNGTLVSTSQHPVMAHNMNQSSNIVSNNTLREKTSSHAEFPHNIHCSQSVQFDSTTKKIPRPQTAAESIGREKPAPNVDINMVDKPQIPYHPQGSFINTGSVAYPPPLNQAALDFLQKACHDINTRQSSLQGNEDLNKDKNKSVSVAQFPGMQNQPATDNGGIVRPVQSTGDKSTTGDKPKTLYVCEFCNKVFKRKDHMNRHKARVHAAEIKVIPSGSINQKLPDNVHINHLKNNPLPGVEPLETVSSMNVINSQVSINPECASLYDTLKESQTMLNVSREHPYECLECQKIFTRKDHVFRHKMSHAKVRPFQCSICMKIFTRKDHLVRHRNIHTKERPYNCTHCDKVFTRKDHLDRHLRKHVTEFQLPKV